MSGVQDFPFGIEDVTELLHLRIRRRCSDGAYVDCPFCGEGRGRMKINYVKNVWRCNYCNEHGGMLALYARIHSLTNSEAYREICDSIQNGIGYSYDLPMTHKKKEAEVEPVNRAENSVIHKTLTGLLGMLKLSEQHREHLRNVRGLSDEQIEQLGYKSTPPFYMCGPLTSRLIEQGYTVEGVPGFYQKDGKWTINFSTMTAGILIPARGIDGMIRGFQIRLDVPLKNDDEDKDKPGAKYIWFSSGSKPMGTTAGSPLHFVGNPFARVVYVTEGILKSDIAHMLMDRTFAAIAGINNTAQLDMLFALLAENGTQTIIEAADMDKYRNEHVNKGASTIYLLAKKHGLSFRRLTWNPNYKGIDDWQLAVRRSKERKEDCMTNFKTRFLYGLCGYDAIDDEITKWRERKETELYLHEYLGFTEEEYAFFLKYSREKMIRYLLDCQTTQRYRIYQLDFSGNAVIPFAFSGIKELHKAGYEQPPAANYRMVCDGALLCDKNDSEQKRLEFIFQRYNNELPRDYTGRSISPSDIIELYDGSERRYFYCDEQGFCPVQFSPLLVKNK